MSTEPRKRVLVIDDQSDIRLMCRANLALDGYEVLEADDGLAALAVIARSRPDLILLDVMMPRMDGWELLERLKDSPDTADIPVVLLTARVQRDDELRGWRAGASEYLSKPFNPSTLTEVVARALSARPDDAERRRHAIEKLSIR